MPIVEPLSKKHARKSFDCGVEELNLFLQRTARQHQEKGVSKTFVLVEQTTILGFFTLAATEGFSDELPPEIAKKFPSKIPAVILARLAVDKNYQGKGYGSALLAEAFIRVSSASRQLGIAGMFVDAKDEAAAAFYQKFGFVPLPDHSLRLFLPLATVLSLIESSGDNS